MFKKQKNKSDIKFTFIFMIMCYNYYVWENFKIRSMTLCSKGILIWVQQILF